jgi:ribosomal protein L37AE/L43A
MSLRDCFDRTPQDCGVDNQCVLEYDTDDQFPTCVPLLDRITNMDLSNERELFQKILVRLLPPAPPTETGKARVTLALQQLYEEMKPRIDRKLRDLREYGTTTSWQSLVKAVSEDIIHEIEDYDCTICFDDLRDPQQGPLWRCSTCSSIFHKKCIMSWFKEANHIYGCPLCKTRLRVNLITQEISVWQPVEGFPPRLAMITFAVIVCIVYGGKV